MPVSEHTDMSVAIRPAATVVILRDGESGPEVLLVARNSKAGFARGAWVFPGGAVDSHELEGRDEHVAARLAAVREVEEESGLDLVAEDLLQVSHWLTPEQSNKRFATWFFVYHSRRDQPVVVDGAEIVEYRWARPRVLLDEHRNGELKLVPPTYVTLTELSRQHTAGDTVAAYRRRGVRYFLPRFTMHGERMCFLYREDAGYDTENPELAGVRHRAYMDDSGCHYECDIDD